MIRRRSVLLALFVALAGIASSVLAVPLSPGDSTNPPNPPLTDYMLPPGDVLAHETRTLDVIYDDPQNQTGGLGNRQATYESWVIRGGAGKLAFVYEFQPVGEPPMGRELSNLTVTGFSGFSTDVTGTADTGAGGETKLSRSTDGSTIKFEAIFDGNSTLPFAVIATNATAFNRNGTVSTTFFDEISTPNAPDRGYGAFPATLNLAGTFQPAESSAAVPLPAAAWAFIVAMPLVFICRRWFNASPV